MNNLFSRKATKITLGILGLIIIVTGVVIANPRLRAITVNLGRINYPTLSVSSYGLTPNNPAEEVANTNSVDFHTLMRACPTSGCNIVFEPGKYYFGFGPASGVMSTYDASTASGEAFSFTGYQNLKLSGGGTILLFKDSTQPFTFTNCSNITIKQLTIDWQRPPYTLGSITKLSSATDGAAGVITMSVASSYDLTDLASKFKMGQTGQAYSSISRFNTALNRMDPTFYEVDKPNVAPFKVTSYDQPSSTVTIEVQSPTDFQSLKVADAILLRHQYYFSNAFAVLNSQNISFDSININTAPGIGIDATSDKNISLNNVDIEPATGMPMSTTADATHFTADNGYLTITNSTFKNMGDDGTDIQNHYYPVVSQPDSQTLDVWYDFPQTGNDINNSFTVANPGDTIEFVNGSNLASTSSGKVASINTVSNPALAGLPANYTVNAHNNQKLYQIHFTAPVSNIAVSTSDKPGTLLLDKSKEPIVTIDHAIVENGQARGILINDDASPVNGETATISDSTIANNVGNAVQLQCSLFWEEGPCSNNVKISNNTLTMLYPNNVAVITGNTTLWDNPAISSPQSTNNQNISIQKNDIEGIFNTAFSLNQTLDAVVDQNTINGILSPGQNSQTGVTLLDSAGASITNNSYNSHANAVAGWGGTVTQPDSDGTYTSAYSFMKPIDGTYKPSNTLISGNAGFATPAISQIKAQDCTTGANLNLPGVDTPSDKCIRMIATGAYQDGYVVVTNPSTQTTEFNSGLLIPNTTYTPNQQMNVAADFGPITHSINITFYLCLDSAMKTCVSATSSATPGNSQFYSDTAIPMSTTTIPYQKVSRVGFIGDSITQIGLPAYSDISDAASGVTGSVLGGYVQAVPGSTSLDWSPNQHYLPSTSLFQQAVNYFKANKVTYVSVMLGTNDAQENVTSATYLKNLTAVVSGLWSNGFTVILNNPPGSTVASIQPNLQSYAQAISGANLINGKSVIAGDTQALSVFNSTSSLLDIDKINPTFPAGRLTLGQLWSKKLIGAIQSGAATTP